MSIIDNALRDARYHLSSVEDPAARDCLDALTRAVSHLAGDSDSDDEDSPDSYDYSDDEDLRSHYVPDEDSHVEDYERHAWSIANAARLERSARNRAIAEKALRAAGKIK